MGSSTARRLAASGSSREMVDKGPYPEVDGVVRWRCVDLRFVIKKRFGVDLDEASMRNSTASIGPGPPIASCLARDGAGAH